MRVFINEIKKLFDLKILFLIAVIGAITWFIFLDEALSSYASLSKHGIYGSYQTEMFRIYGDTLEPDELADFDFPRRYAEIAAIGDEIIAGEPEVFLKYGISSFIEYIELTSIAWSVEEAHLNPIERDDEIAMSLTLNGGSGQTVEEWYASPLMKWSSLETIEDRYADYQPWLEAYIKYDARPIVVDTAKRILAEKNNNLINEYLMSGFSLYAAGVGGFAVIALLFLVMPPLLTDHSRNVNLLQYSSVVGRKILRIQFAAAFASAFVLSTALIVVSFTPFIILSSEYWNTRILSNGNIHMWLYDITFGQYVYILAGLIIALCVCTACLAFILARFSNNIINAIIKAVPVGLALLGLCAIAINIALSNNNIVFTQVFRGRFHVPEVIVCCVFSVAAFVAAGIVTIREKRVDVL